MKHTIYRRVAALLLALWLLPTLTACGERKSAENRAEEPDGTAYVAQPVGCTLPLGDVTALCSQGGALYLAGHLLEEDGETEELSGGFSTSMAAVGGGDDGGSSFIFSGGMGRLALFRLDPSTGESTELTGYATASPEGSSVSVAALTPGAGGTLWVLEETAAGLDFSGDAFSFDGDVINQINSGPLSRRWRKLDTAGAELSALDVTDLAERLGVESIAGMTMDNQDRLYVSTGSGAAVLDRNGETLFTLKGQDLSGTLVRMDRGVGVLTADGGLVRAIDPQAQAWGRDYPLSGSVRKLYAGDGTHAFYYDSGDSLYAVPAGGGLGERLLSWSGVGVDRGKLDGFAFLPDGRGAALLAGQTGWPASYELALLSQADRKSQEERTVLTFATLDLRSEMRTSILNFNRSNGKYRIEIRDYSELNTVDDPTAGLIRLNTEVAAGNVPDLLDASGDIPIRQYGARGVLEDLWPYIDSDPELGREGVMARVLQAASAGGALYQIFTSFTIQTAAGDPAIVGDRTGWTLPELQEALAKLPDGGTVLGEGETSMSMLRTLLSQNLDKYLDWSGGRAYFDTPDFCALLSFCASFPAQSDPLATSSTDAYTAVSSREQLLLPAILSDFDSVQLYKELFGGDASFVGYPREEGCGACFDISGGMALSSTCGDKAGAWSFLRTLLLPVDEDFFGAFPVNRESFERMMAESMEAEYVTDENGELYLGEDGEPVLQGAGIWFIGSRMIEMRPATQAECDQVMELYEQIDAVAGQDENVWSIVQECALAYFASGRTAEETAKAVQSRVSLYMNEQL